MTSRATGEAASGRFRAALSFQQGPIGQPFSRTDLLSNLLLYMPFGLLLATRRRARGGSGAGAALWALVLGAMLSALVETLQLFSASRTSSLGDLAANSMGALVGGIVGAAWGMRMLIRAEGGVRRRWIDRPVELAAILLLAAMAGDALFQYWPTLDVAEVWGNLKRSTFSLSSGLALHPWHYWLVKRVGVYAVLTVLLAAMAMIGRTWSDAVGYRGAWSTPARAAIWAGLFGLALELGQFLIPGRHPSPTDVLCFALGAGLGSALAGARNRRLRLAKASAALTANRKTPAAGR